MRPPHKREGRPPDEAAFPDSSLAERENYYPKRPNPTSLYRHRPGCALLVKRTILRCGGTWRLPSWRT
jgi:hypothetical protein